MERWIDPGIVKHLKSKFRCAWHGYHGGAHWARVRMNAQLLAKLHESQGLAVDWDIINLFAVIHDSQRDDEGDDDEHGKRAADSLHALRGVWFALPDEPFQELHRACALHSDGLTQDNSLNVKICWDADRLDLFRVGTIPDPKYLCTNPAKKTSFIQAAIRRTQKQS